MNSPVLNEIRDDIWHLLVHVYTYQDKSRRVLEVTPTRYELANEIVALNALADSITLRVARLADQRSDVRSIKSLKKKHFNSTKRLENLLEEFEDQAKPVRTQRNERIAHMKGSELSAYQIAPLTPETVACIEKLVELVDEFSGQPVEYTLRVGSQESPLNLRRSIMESKRVPV
jgi:hypothetical protein